MDLLSAVKAIMPSSLKGWLIYALTIITTLIALVAWDVTNSDYFREHLLKIVDRNDLKARFCSEAFEQEAKDVIATLKAEAVVIWVTDLSGFAAHKRVLFALDVEHRTKITDSWINKSAPIYATEQSRLDITYLLEGNVVCGEFEIFSDVGRRIEEETGGKYFCSVPVPPTVGHMIGVMTAYFKEKPEMTSALKLELRRAARGIVYD